MSGSIPILRPDEAPKDRAQRHVNSAAHSSLAEMILAGIHGDVIDEPVVSTAFCRRSRLRLVVRLVRYDGPLWEPAAKVPVVVPAVVPALRDVEAAALHAAPGSTEKPVTVKRLATLAGYRPTGHFREAVRGLIDRKLLERVRGGVRRRATS